MIYESKKIDPALLPFRLGKTVGKISYAEILYPGIYFVCIHTKEKRFLSDDEYYIVERNIPILSEDAKAYGKKIPDHPDLLLYSKDDERSGAQIVEYELYYHLQQEGYDLPDHTTLYSVALFGREYYPEYFGEHPAPIETPWGRTLRYYKFDNGIFWIHTELCQEILAVCYPYTTEFTRWTSAQARYIEQKDLHKNSHAEEYAFFSKKESELALYDLLKTRTFWEKTGLIDKAALMNAIWEDYPKIVQKYNYEEKTGYREEELFLMNMTCEEIIPCHSSARLIKKTQNAGTLYLHLETLSAKKE